MTWTKLDTVLIKAQFLLRDDGDTVGGGEVLGLMEQEDESIYGISSNSYWLSTNMNKLILILCLAIIIAGVYAVLNIMGVQLGKKRVVDNLLDTEMSFGSVDKKQRRTRRFLNYVEKMQSKGILKLDKFKEDDLKFNLQRVGWSIYGIPLTPGAYNGIKWIVRLALLVVSALIVLLSQNTAFFVIALVGWFLVSACDIFMTSQIKAMDNEIYANFLEFYLMLHHTMISDGGATLTSLVSLYNKNAKGEMKRVTDRILYCFDTYGESLGCDMLTDAFRHEYVTRLMRLIKGYVRGADVRDDMKGFRALLIENRERDIMAASEKLQMKARMSFYILMPVLVQAIISAMAIYFGDISQVTSMM